MHNESSEARAEAVAEPGFFRLLNRLLLEARGRPVVQNVFWELAATPRIWTKRGSLEPYQVRASRAALVDATGATPKRIRGALAWLVRRGFLVRLDTGCKTVAVYQLVVHEIELPHEKGQDDKPVSASEATTYATDKTQKGQDGPKRAKKGPRWQKPNAMPGNGLRQPSKPKGPRKGQGSIEVEENQDPKPPRVCEKTGATTRDARAIQDLPLAERTAALNRIVRPRTHTEGKP